MQFRTFKLWLVPPPKGAVTRSSGWKPYNDPVTERYHTSPSNCALLLEMALSTFVPSSTEWTLAFGSRVCVHQVNGIWYHEAATTGFSDVKNLFFNIRGHVALCGHVEMVVFKDNVNHLLCSWEIEAPYGNYRVDSYSMNNKNKTRICCQYTFQKNIMLCMSSE